MYFIFPQRDHPDHETLRDNYFKTKEMLKSSISVLSASQNSLTYLTAAAVLPFFRQRLIVTKEIEAVHVTPEVNHNLFSSELSELIKILGNIK